MGMFGAFLGGFAGGAIGRPKEPKYLYLRPGQRPVTVSAAELQHQLLVQQQQLLLHQQQLLYQQQQQQPPGQQQLPPASQPVKGSLDDPERPF